MLSPDNTMKLCSQCNKWLPLTTEFWHRHKQTRDGFHNPCKECNAERNRETYLKDKDRIKEQVKIYRQDNLEKTKTYRKQWGFENADKVREYNHQYQHNNPDKRRIWGKKYRENNREKTATLARQRRARDKGAEGRHTIEEIHSLYRVQGGLCFHCGVNLTVTGYHGDHWIPLSRGGTNWIENIRLLCPKCNRRKSDKLPSEWSDKYR